MTLLWAAARFTPCCLKACQSASRPGGEVIIRVVAGRCVAPVDCIDPMEAQASCQSQSDLANLICRKHVAASAIVA